MRKALGKVHTLHAPQEIHNNKRERNQCKMTVLDVISLVGIKLKIQNYIKILKKKLEVARNSITYDPEGALFLPVYALVKLCQQHVQQQKARRYVQVAYNLQCTSTVNNVHEYASIYSQCSMSDRRRRSLSDAVRGFHLASLLRCLSASAA